ncbi:MAG TPA: hypothetical protein VKJ47_22140 [Candidatus Binatia bacterium]|nr:hypothetical protein [Candidatus Binatia bacterium]
MLDILMRHRQLLFSLLLVLSLCTQAAGAERRVYKIALGFPFPPGTSGCWKG